MVHTIPVEAAIARVLPLIEPDWVKQFLFKDDAELDIRTLTSGTSRHFALVGEDNTSAQGEQDDALTQLFMKSHWVCVPGYSYGELSLSVALTERECTGSAKVQHVGRVVQSNKTGDVMAVAMNGSGPVQVVLMLMDSIKHRHRFYISFENQMFSDLIHSNAPLTPSRFAQFASSSIHINEHRTCVSCNPFSTTPFCGCILPLQFRRHRSAYDLATTVNNVCTHFGGFTGSMTCSFPGSKGLTVRPMEVTGGIMHDYQPGTLSRMIFWAVSQMLSSSSFTPSYVPVKSSRRLQAPASGEEHQENIIDLGAVLQHIIPRTRRSSSVGLSSQAPVNYLGTCEIGPAEPLDKAILEKQQKSAEVLRRRKIRNRESATRYNRRVQARRLGLIADIEAEQGKVRDLRSKLGKLREQNKALCKQLLNGEAKPQPERN